MKKIVVTGPECTGKTTLAKALAVRLECPCVPEHSTEYLKNLGHPYVYGDLVKIAKGQIELEKKMVIKNNPYLVCDTYMLVMKIWSEYRFGKTDPFILKMLEGSSDRLYVLCDYHIPYEPGPFRENPFDRDFLYETYKAELEKLGFNYLVAAGPIEVRVNQVLAHL